MKEIESIINKSEVCFLAMADKDQPYVIPMNFAYEDKKLYMHCALTGRKIGILKANNKVSITFSVDHELAWQNEDVACSYGMKSRSVVAQGTVSFVENYDEKVEILQKVMKKYTQRDNFKYSKPSIENVCIFVVECNEIKGKLIGY